MKPDKPKENNIEWNKLVIPLSEPEKHKHFFEWRDGECKCKLCSLGLLGVVDIDNGRPM